MELTKTNGFCEMNEMEMQEVDGGSITLATVLFTALGYEVTVGLCLKAGVAIGIAAGGAVILSKDE